MALLHKSIVVGVPTRPTVDGGVGRSQVGGGVPAPHGIRKPQPASGVGVLEADVQVNNRTPNGTEGSLTGMVTVVDVGSVGFSTAGQSGAASFERAYRATNFAGSGGIVSNGVALYGRFSYLNGQGGVDGDVHAEYQFEASDIASGFLGAAVEAKYAAAPAATATGSLTVSTKAEGAVFSTDAFVSGSGALAASVGVADDAQLAGEGVFGLLEADFGAKFTAATSGTGSLAASSVSSFEVFTYQSGTGELLVAAAPKFVPFLSGTGTLVPSFKVQPGGGLSAAGALSASAAIQTFKPMGINKSGTQAAAVNQWVKVVGWTPDTATYPGTVIENDGIRPGAATANIVAELRYAYEYGNHQMRICVDGVPVATSAMNVYPNAGTGNSNNIVRVNVSGVALTSGLVTMEFWTSTSFSGAHNISASGTFLRVTD